MLHESYCNLVGDPAKLGSCEKRTSNMSPHLEVNCTMNDLLPSKVFSDMNLTPGTVMLPRLVEARPTFAQSDVVLVH